MSLSVTSQPTALAILQTLSLQTSSSQTSGAEAASPSQTTTPAPASSVSADLSGAATQGLSGGVPASQALSAADAAEAAGQTVLGLLQQLRTVAGQAADPTTSASARTGLDQQFQAGTAQIAPTLAAATINGVNLVDGSQGSGLKVALGDGATASLTPADLSLGGSTLGLPANASVATTTAAASAFASLGGAIGATSDALSTLGAQSDQISAHAGFVQTLGQALTSPDQDGGDSVRLLALQLSQQLSAQPASIANQSPQSILSLFRS